MRDISKVLDDSIAFRDKRKNNRYSLLTRGERASIELEVDSNVGVVIHEAIKVAAKEHDVAMADALVSSLRERFSLRQGRLSSMNTKPLTWRERQFMFRGMDGLVRGPSSEYSDA